MKKMFLIVLSLLLFLSACSGYYTEEAVLDIRDSYKDEISMLEDRIAQLESALLSSYDEGYFTGLGEGYDEGYDEGHADGYNSGYDEGYDNGYNSGIAEGYDEGFDDGRSQGWNNAVQHYRAWILDSEYTDLWGELYNALAAFWSGDTSDLSSFEDGLYDTILDIYAEYKADADPDTPKDPDPPDPPDPPEPPEDPPPPSRTVYITESGTKYHAAGCQSLWNSKIEIDKSVAIARGYKPCSKCNP